MIGKKKFLTQNGIIEVINKFSNYRKNIEHKIISNQKY